MHYNVNTKHSDTTTERRGHYVVLRERFRTHVGAQRPARVMWSVPKARPVCLGSISHKTQVTPKDSQIIDDDD